MRIAARKDAFHNLVGKIFTDRGWAALDLSRLGSGKPDWLFVRKSLAVLVEVKTPGWKGHLKAGTGEAQDLFRLSWKACPVLLIETLEAAILEADTLRQVSSVAS